MAGTHGGARKEAGRLPGPQIDKRIARRFQPGLSKMMKELADDPTMMDRLRVLSEDPDPVIALNAFNLILKHSTPIPKAPEERVNITLPDLSTETGVGAALELVAHETASGHLPSHQARELTKTLTARLEALQAVDMSRRIEQLEHDLRRVKGENVAIGGNVRVIGQAEH